MLLLVLAGASSVLLVVLLLATKRALHGSQVERKQPRHVSNPQRITTVSDMHGLYEQFHPGVQPVGMSTDAGKVEMVPRLLLFSSSGLEH